MRGPDVTDDVDRQLVSKKRLLSLQPLGIGYVTVTSAIPTLEIIFWIDFLEKT